MISVIIINCYTKNSDPNLDQLINHFNDPLFKVSLLKVNHPNYKKNYQDDHFMQALTLTCEQDYNYYLIIKDNSLCTTNKLTKKIKKAINTEADVYFLASYLDACHLYQPVENNKNLKYTFNCGATQAFMITNRVKQKLLDEMVVKKKSLSYLLKDNIKNNQLKAVVFYPTIIAFDALLATDNEEYKLLNLCLDIEEESKNTDDTVIIWVIVISLLILFLVVLVPYFKYYHHL